MTYLNDGILYTIVYATKWFFASNIFIISLFKSVHSDVNLKLMHGQILIEEKAWI